MIALGVALALQVWSVAPVAASVVYCIGEDGHSGFEVVEAGARGCASCCHDKPGAEAGLADAPVSECIDIALSPESGLAGKVTEPERSVSVLALVVASTTVLPRVAFRADRDLEPPRGSPTRMRRHTVLLI